MKFDPTKYERSYRPNFELTQAFWWQQGVFASGIGSLVYLATHGFAVWPVGRQPLRPVPQCPFTADIRPYRSMRSTRN